MWTTEEKTTLMLAIWDQLGKDEAQNGQALVTKMLESFLFCGPGKAKQNARAYLQKRIEGLNERVISVDLEKVKLKQALRNQKTTCEALLLREPDEPFVESDPVE